MEEKCLWTTLLATNDFTLGVVNLHKSLQKVNTKYPFIAIVTANITDENLEILENNGIQYRRFPYLSFTGKPPVEYKTWSTTEECEQFIYWDCTLSKFYCFTFIEYDKVIYVDADIEFWKNCDHYFDYNIPAGSYAPWDSAKTMNGCIFLIKPSLEDFFTCIRIGMDDRCICDEDVLQRWDNSYTTGENQLFPQSDIWIIDDGHYVVDMRRMEHYNGPIKPWMPHYHADASNN